MYPINHYNHEYNQTQHEIHGINTLEVLKIISWTLKVEGTLG